MAFTVQFGATKTQYISNCDIRQLNLDFFCQHDTVNSDFAGVIVDFNKVKVKITLCRADKNFTLYSGPIVIPHNLSNFYSQLWNEQLNTGTTYYNQLQAKGLATKLQCLISTRIDLGGFINLRGNDELQIEYNLSSGSYNASIETGVSQLYVSPMLESGVEWFTPYISQYNIQASDNSAQQVLGNNVYSVMLINTDKTTDLYSSQVFQSMNLSADGGNMNLNWYQLVGQRNAQFPLSESTVTDPTNRRQSFMPMINANPVLQRATVDLTLNSTNVAAASNYIAWRMFYTDARIMTMARSYSNQIFG